MLFGFSSYSQFWMQRGGGLTIDEALDIALDANNNTYTVGYFTGQSSFGGNAISSQGVTDVFITKNDNQGNFLWAVNGGGGSSDRAEAVAVDGLGNVYVTGYFSGTASFGSQTISSAGLQDVFIAKYNTNGVLQWVTSAGGMESDFGFGIDVNNLGEVFITGSFKDMASFGSFSLTATNTTSDIFVAKLNTSGVFQWVKSGSGNYSNLGRSIGADNYGNVYVTGQFSDTLTFDLTHNNQSQNIIFLVKFNSSGVEQWFTTLDGAVSNVANDMVVDSDGEIYVTGDFSGVMYIYDINTGVSSTISTSYVNSAFITKYDSSGLWTQKNAVGSDNFVSSKSIAIDGLGGIYIGGDFECDFTEFRNNYGMANFVSVGKKDVFVAKFNANGTWNYCRQIGGQQQDFGNGVGVNTNGEIHAVGSFEGAINVPVSSNFSPSNLLQWSSAGCVSSNGYCSDSDYGVYRKMNTQGNKDVFIVNGFDETREPYDYFKRTGTGCARDIPPICIENCIDTIFACHTVNLTASSEACSSIGPGITYYWNGNLSGSQSINVNSSGWQFVEAHFGNSCIIQSDSIYVVIEPIPTKPHISDGKGINVESFVPSEVNLCAPDTTLLSAGGFLASSTYWWTGPGLGAGVFDSSIIVSSEGTYSFHVESNGNCETTNSVVVKNNYPLRPFNLKMNLSDTLEVCELEGFLTMVYDSISNPTPNPGCLSDSGFMATSLWGINANVPVNFTCDAYAHFLVDSSRWYTVYDTVIRSNYCYSDTSYVYDSVFVSVNPRPVIIPFQLNLSGNDVLCPGAANELNATGAPNYEWFGPGVNGMSDSTVFAASPGLYRVQSSVADTNQFGCTNQIVVFENLQITLKPQPTVTSSATVICPNSTVVLTSSAINGNHWEGPNGPIPGGQTVTVSDPGNYFSIVNDADSCALVSNTVSLFQYTTPKLEVLGDTVLCPGATTVLFIQANSGAVISWNSPLSGNSPLQVISSPGTYSCSVTSCGITTNASVTISSGNPAAQISPQGVLCADSSLVLEGPPGMVSYTWLPSNESTQNISVSDTGTFTLSIQDASGCQGTSAPFVVEKVLIESGLGQSIFGFCYNDSLNLEADTNLSSYLWMPGGQTSSSITVTESGLFSLSVSDSNGCVRNNIPFQVNQSDSILEVELIGDSIICNYDTVVLSSINQNYSNYLWLPSNQTSSTIEVYQSGTYWLQTIDSLGCALTSDSVKIVVNELPLDSMTVNGVLCKDSSLVLNTGTVWSQYNWTPTNQNTSSISVSSPGIYTVVVTDSNACESLPISYVVNEIVVPVSINYNSLGFCYGDSMVLTANPGMATYSWSPNGSNANSITVFTSEEVYLDVQDTNGCKAQAGPVSFTESSLFTDLNVSGIQEICEGDTLEVFAENPNYVSYTWMPTNTTGLGLEVSESGTFWVVAEDSIGCIISSDSVSVNVIENTLNVPVVSADSIVCSGATVAFSASAGNDSVYWYNTLQGASFYTGTNFNSIVENTTTFYLQTILAPCESEFVSITVETEICEKPIVPNVFTPNGDGANDYWFIEVKGATCFHVDIYNRWGMLLYSLESQNEKWDGTVEKTNQDAADGTYFYILNYCDHRKVAYSEKGFITLIR